MSKIINVIKYEGDNNTFIWKHPCEDFYTSSQLIVHESQEAIFFLNGQALDVFGPEGSPHTLKTQNIPLLTKFVGKFIGEETLFHSEVYFINKTVQMAIKWGTPELVNFIDPVYGVPLKIGASGEMNLEVKDSKKLLLKLVGTTNGIAWGEENNKFTKSLQNSFRALIATSVKTYLATAIRNKGINILEIDEHLEELSGELRKKIISGFEEYGLTIPQFYISTINLPENDLNFKRIRELHTINLQTQMAKAEGIVRTAQAESQAGVVAAERKITMEQQITETEIAKKEAERLLIDAQAKAEAVKYAGYAEAEVMRSKGYTQKDIFQTDIQKTYAESIGKMGGSSGSGVVNDIVGLSVGLAAVGQITPKINGIINGISDEEKTKPSTITCPNCRKEVPLGAKFCMECGKVIELFFDDDTICPNCGKKTKNGKFCMECGKPLKKKCSKCGAELVSEAKFCPECGEKIV